MKSGSSYKFLIFGLIISLWLLAIPGTALAVHQLPVVSGFTVTTFATPVEVNGITSDPAGNIYAIDQGAGVITKITPSGTQTVVTTLGGSGWINIYFDPVSTNLFVTNFTLKLVKRVTLAGVTTDLITGLSGGPSGITGDADGNIYVAEQGPANLILKLFPGGSDTIYSSSGLSNPDGINFGSDGKLYVGNRGTGDVTVVPVGGGAAVQLAGGLTQPFDALPDSNGNVYVPHPTLGTLSKITPGGSVSTFGLGFHEPKNLAFDPSGNLFVVDSSADTIYKVAAVDVLLPLDLTTCGSPINGEEILLDVEGQTYILANDITLPAAENCFFITANNVTLDGNGKTITGFGNAGNGVTVLGSFQPPNDPTLDAPIVGFTIKNLNVTGFALGISFENGDGGTVRDNQLDSNTFGIILNSDSVGNTITANILTDQVSTGIRAASGSIGNDFTGNVISGSGIFDAQDASTGGSGTAGTDNTWTGNICDSSSPDGLCDDLPGGNFEVLLTPASETNTVGTDHTVTATVSQNGVAAVFQVVFIVVSGPNGGTDSDTSSSPSGTCNRDTNDDCIANASGVVSWTYTGTGGPGTDKIKACTLATPITCSSEVTKVWEVDSPDADGDGVPDDIDICPGTPDGVVAVDDKGCDASDLFERLVAEINGLVGPKGIRNSLLVKLNGVQTAIENGQDKVALNKLKSFVNHVKALDGKKLTSGQASLFQQLADVISQTIEGT